MLGWYDVVQEETKAKKRGGRMGTSAYGVGKMKGEFIEEGGRCTEIREREGESERECVRE